jgi:malate dehydrogenase (oxaloacetate-decarboxylating)(NADP+)
MSDQKSLYDAALEYHRKPQPGKIKIAPTKPLTTAKDLSLAYSPGVAAACEEIVRDPATVSQMTARGNLVAVITNGTAVLGLGAIGPLAAKPVMEGKGVLFKKFANIDVFDIEINERDPHKLIDIIASLEPTFGGINLEDIKAPECFLVERELRKRVQIPVFHDDQHGTAIIVGAAVRNALYVVGKPIAEVKLVASGAGAAGIACLDMLVRLGVKPEHIIVCDRLGVVYKGRHEEMDADKARYARDTPHRTLGDALPGADLFLGLSAPGVLKPEMVKTMADKPVILALANPTPEIMPELAIEARPDAIICTGRSDYPNQVNNALCFPYIFRGALDVGATTINEDMKLACVEAIAELARLEASDISAQAYGGASTAFGAQNLIPKPFDPRLIVHLAPAVAKAAMDSGVATRPIADLKAYREQMTSFIFRTGLVMKPVFEAAKADPKRVVYSEGEEEVILRAVQTVVDDGLARPILIGRPEVIERRIDKLGLRIRAGEHFELTNINDDKRFRDYWTQYHGLLERKGVTPSIAKAIIRTRGTVVAALMVERGEADAMICGVVGRYKRKLDYVLEVIGLKPGVRSAAALSAVASDRGTVFICDTHVNPDPSAEEICDAALLAAERVRLFGIKPKVALLSHSNFGSFETASSRKMAQALKLIRAKDPALDVEGEMQADTALDESIRERIFPNSRLKGQANLFIMPNLDAANIAYNMGRVVSEGVAIGPMLLGVAKPAHVLTTAATVRRVINMTAVATVDAQRMAQA